MRLSTNGLVQLITHEAVVPGPYIDSAGVWTYGIGHTVNAGGLDPAKMPRGMPEDLNRAISHVFDVFDDDLDSYERRVNEAVTVPLAQHEFDALVSFDFNTGGIFRAQLTTKLNAGRPRSEVANAFFGWLRPPEIRGRRTAEATLFEHGVYSPAGARLMRVDERGKLQGTLRTMPRAELLALAKTTTTTETIPAVGPTNWWNSLSKGV